MRKGRLRLILSCLFLILGANCLAWGQIPDLEKRAAEIAGQVNNRMEEYRDLAQEIARRQQRQVEDQLRPILPETDQIVPERTLIFITLGETPEQNVDANRRLLQQVKTMAPDAEVVIRGLPAGMRHLDALALYLKKVNEDIKLPGLRLDPTLFRKYQVSVAPTMILERNGEKVAEVRGLINPAWMRRQVENGQKGDLGQMGPTAAIAERDLIEELQGRLMAVDWEKKKKEAYSRYWQKYRFCELPEAKEDRQFTLDAKFIVPQDIVLPDDTVAARKGEVTDLFRIVKPTFVLLIFDAAKPKQVAWAQTTAKEFQGKLRVKYIATQIPDVTDGWKSLEKLEEQLKGPVYLLNEQLRDRFQVKRVPTLVKPATDHFEVEEVCLVPEVNREKKNTISEGSN